VSESQDILGVPTEFDHETQDRTSSIPKKTLKITVHLFGILI